MGKPALIIIDMSRDFFRDGRLASLKPQMTSAINRLIKHWRSNDLPIIWVWQEFKDDLSDAFLLMRQTRTKITIEGTDGAKLLPELDFKDSDFKVIKKRYSSFLKPGWMRF